MAAPTPQTADALTKRLGGAALGAFELLTVYLGDRLGLYRALSAGADFADGEVLPVEHDFFRFYRLLGRRQA